MSTPKARVLAAGSRLAGLASSSAARRRQAAFEFCCVGESANDVIQADLDTLGSLAAALIPGWCRALLEDEDLLVNELAAVALALQGEDGATELLTHLDHEHFAIRSKVVIGFTALGRHARWAVPSLIRAHSEEPTWYVRSLLIQCLGRIGGSRAVAALESLLYKAPVDEQGDIVLALAAARGALTLE